MTRTRKTLMIAGGLLVAAAGSGYVMLLRADHRAIAEAGIGDAAAPAAAVTAANDGHTAQGTIAPSAPVAPVIAAPAKPSAPPPTVHVVTVEPEDATPPKAKPAQPVQAPVQAAQSAQPAQSTQSAPPAQAAQAARPSQQAAYQPPQHAARKRDGLERHAAAPSAMKSETPETAALVRESAKLDPSLPAPQYVATPSRDRQHTSAGANSVAAAMTDQLVRQSSNIKAPAPANAGPGATQ